MIQELYNLDQTYILISFIEQNSGVRFIIQVGTVIIQILKQLFEKIIKAQQIFDNKNINILNLLFNNILLPNGDLIYQYNP